VVYRDPRSYYSLQGLKVAMKKYIAFLRAINVAGRYVKMERLRSIFEKIGFADVETYINSGNIVFISDADNPKILEQEIEQQLQVALGFEVPTFIRTNQELSVIANYQPFTDLQLKSAVALNIAFLTDPIASDNIKILDTLQTSIDDFHSNDREIYWLCRVKQSDSKFSNAVLEKRLKVKATIRATSTIEKMVAKYS
jgi:uncharacterized protein (DUF1697 family)